MTLTDEQIAILKKTASLPMPEAEFVRLRQKMEVLHKQVVEALQPELLRIVFSAQIDLLRGTATSEVLMQMYTSGFAMGVAFTETRELEKLGGL